MRRGRPFGALCHARPPQSACRFTFGGHLVLLDRLAQLGRRLAVRLRPEDFVLALFLVQRGVPPLVRGRGVGVAPDRDARVDGLEACDRHAVARVVRRVLRWRRAAHGDRGSGLHGTVCCERGPGETCVRRDAFGSSMSKLRRLHTTSQLPIIGSRCAERVLLPDESAPVRGCATGHRWRYGRCGCSLGLGQHFKQLLSLFKLSCLPPLLHRLCGRRGTSWCRGGAGSGWVRAALTSAALLPLIIFAARTS